MKKKDIGENLCVVTNRTSTSNEDYLNEPNSFSRLFELGKSFKTAPRAFSKVFSFIVNSKILLIKNIMLLAMINFAEA